MPYAAPVPHSTTASTSPRRVAPINLESCARGPRQARQNLPSPRLARERAHELVDDDALRIHQKGLGRAVHAPIDGRAPVVVDADRLVRVTQLREPFERVVIFILPIQPDEGNDSGVADLHQHRVLRAAFHAPGAQTFSRYQRPLSSCELTRWCASVRLGKANPGAARPTRGETIMPFSGEWRMPIASTTTSSAKSASGSAKRFNPRPASRRRPPAPPRRGCGRADSADRGPPPRRRSP